MLYLQCLFPVTSGEIQVIGFRISYAKIAQSVDKVPFLLVEFIRVEALGHAPRSVEATLAQMHLSEVLSDAEYIEKKPSGNGFQTGLGPSDLGGLSSLQTNSPSTNPIAKV